MPCTSLPSSTPQLLCQTVREMSEDTNTNEKKFHHDEYAMLLGNR